MSLGPVHLLLAIVAAQRLAELLWSSRNERRLRRLGAVEHGAGHYPLIVAVHAGLLGTLFPTVPAERAIDLAWLLVVIGLQPARLWVLATLGARWTTRILVLPDAAPIEAGPYRLLRHPNYAIVAVEVPAIALAAGAPTATFLFGLANLAVLAVRVRVEDAALGRRGAGRAGPR